MIFNIVFFISLTSVLIQGTTLHTVAKWLNVALPQENKKNAAWEVYMSEQAKKIITELTIPENGFAAGKKVVELHFPSTSVISLIKRRDHYITPSGTTTIDSEDTLFILSQDKESISKVYECLQVTPPIPGRE